ncbi:MAG: rubredoxin [Dethiosulfatibacter sp.]|nr:rubredoxin [Dethiosulfatibacter sp.]
MEKLLKCSVCGYVTEESKLGDKCPKCGAPREKFELLSDEATNKIINSDRTNDIHMDIINLCMAIEELADEGVELDLDPPCVDIFKKAQDMAWQLKQMCKAEIAGHVGKGKW